MSVAGTLAVYNSEPKIRTIHSNNVIAPIAGANPADTAYVKLPNVRGQLHVEITSGDNNYTSSYDITGGFGEFAGDYTQNWYPETFSPVGCTVTVPFTNVIQITTPAADAGGRIYFMQFFPVQGVGPQIRQTSANIIGNNILTVKLLKRYVSNGW